MFLFLPFAFYNLIFSVLAGLGVVVVMRSSSVVGMWCGLELSFFGIIPILSGDSTSELDGSVKYFFVQGLGSSFFILSIAWAMSGVKVWMWGFLVLGVMFNVGLFPFHAWLPTVVGGAGWISCFFLMVVVNTGQFWMLGKLPLPEWVVLVLLVSGVLTSIVGSLGGVNQVCVRPLLGYSSLSHQGWLLGLCLFSWEGFLIYFSIYATTLLLILNSVVAGGTNAVPLGVYFLSMSGLPPFVGSFMKLVGVVCLMEVSWVLVGFLLVSSVISSVYYVWVFVRLLLNGEGTLEGVGGSGGVADLYVFLLITLSGPFLLMLMVCW